LFVKDVEPRLPSGNCGHALRPQRWAHVISPSQKVTDTRDVKLLEEEFSKEVMNIDNHGDKFEDVTEHQPKEKPPNVKGREQDIAHGCQGLRKSSPRNLTGGARVADAAAGTKAAEGVRQARNQ
jgi:hypothetical protein